MDTDTDPRIIINISDFKDSGSDEINILAALDNIISISDDDLPELISDSDMSDDIEIFNNLDNAIIVSDSDTDMEDDVELLHWAEINDINMNKYIQVESDEDDGYHSDISNFSFQ